MRLTNHIVEFCIEHAEERKRKLNLSLYVCVFVCVALTFAVQVCLLICVAWFLLDMCVYDGQRSGSISQWRRTHDSCYQLAKYNWTDYSCACKLHYFIALPGLCKQIYLCRHIIRWRLYVYICFFIIIIKNRPLPGKCLGLLLYHSEKQAVRVTSRAAPGAFKQWILTDGVSGITSLSCHNVLTQMYSTSLEFIL